MPAWAFSRAMERRGESWSARRTRLVRTGDISMAGQDEADGTSAARAADQSDAAAKDDAAEKEWELAADAEAARIADAIARNRRATAMAVVTALVVATS